MATANTQSERHQNVHAITSLVIDEDNNAGDNATDETPYSGLFISPSEVIGRAADVSGFPVTCATSQGKVDYTDPNVLFSTVSLGDLSDVSFTSVTGGNYLQYDGTDWVNASLALNDFDDVTLTGPAANEVLVYNGADWVNSENITLADDITTSGNTSIGTNSSSLLGFYGAAAVGRPAIATPDTNFVASGAVPDNGEATYAGYTVEGIVTNLRLLGVLT